jgi:hypothetical protein
MQPVGFKPFAATCEASASTLRPHLLLYAALDVGIRIFEEEEKCLVSIKLL